MEDDDRQHRDGAKTVDVRPVIAALVWGLEIGWQNAGSIRLELTAEFENDRFRLAKVVAYYAASKRRRIITSLKP